MGAFSALRTRLMRSSVSLWYSWVPCEKFRRATFMPLRTSLVSISTLLVAGPMVQTILVLLKRNHILCHLAMMILRRGKLRVFCL